MSTLHPFLYPPESLLSEKKNYFNEKHYVFSRVHLKYLQKKTPRGVGSALPELTDRSTILNRHCFTRVWRLDSPPPVILGGGCSRGGPQLAKSDLSQPSSAAVAHFPALDCTKAVSP